MALNAAKDVSNLVKSGQRSVDVRNDVRNDVQLNIFHPVFSEAPCAMIRKVQPVRNSEIIDASRGNDSITSCDLWTALNYDPWKGKKLNAYDSVQDDGGTVTRDNKKDISCPGRDDGGAVTRDNKKDDSCPGRDDGGTVTRDNKKDVSCLTREHRKEYDNITYDLKKKENENDYLSYDSQKGNNVFHNTLMDNSGSVTAPLIVNTLMGNSGHHLTAPLIVNTLMDNSGHHLTAPLIVNTLMGNSHNSGRETAPLIGNTLMDNSGSVTAPLIVNDYSTIDSQIDSINTSYNPWIDSEYMESNRDLNKCMIRSSGVPNRDGPLRVPSICGDELRRMFAEKRRLLKESGLGQQGIERGKGGQGEECCRLQTIQGEKEPEGVNAMQTMKMQKMRDDDRHKRSSFSSSSDSSICDECERMSYLRRRRSYNLVYSSSSSSESSVCDDSDCSQCRDHPCDCSDCPPPPPSLPGPDLGQLKMNVQWIFNVLTVKVYNGRGIRRTQSSIFGESNKSNLYVKVVLDTSTFRSISNSRIVSGTDCPEFNQEFSFDLTEINNSSILFLSIWDRDSDIQQDFIGAISVAIKRSNWSIHGWFDLILPDFNYVQSILSDCTGITDCVVAKDSSVKKKKKKSKLSSLWASFRTKKSKKDLKLTLGYGQATGLNIKGPLTSGVNNVDIQSKMEHDERRSQEFKKRAEQKKSVKWSRSLVAPTKIEVNRPQFRPSSKNDISSMIPTKDLLPPPQPVLVSSSQELGFTTTQGIQDMAMEMSLPSIIKPLSLSVSSKPIARFLPSSAEKVSDEVNQLNSTIIKPTPESALISGNNFIDQLLAQRIDISVQRKGPRSTLLPMQPIKLSKKCIFSTPIAINLKPEALEFMNSEECNLQETNLPIFVATQSSKAADVIPVNDLLAKQHDSDLPLTESAHNISDQSSQSEALNDQHRSLPHSYSVQDISNVIRLISANNISKSVEDNNNSEVSECMYNIISPWARKQTISKNNDTADYICNLMSSRSARLTNSKLNHSKDENLSDCIYNFMTPTSGRPTHWNHVAERKTHADVSSNSNHRETTAKKEDMNVSDCMQNLKALLATVNLNVSDDAHDTFTPFSGRFTTNRPRPAINARDCDGEDLDASDESCCVVTPVHKRMVTTHQRLRDAVPPKMTEHNKEKQHPRCLQNMSGLSLMEQSGVVAINSDCVLDESGQKMQTPKRALLKRCYLFSEPRLALTNGASGLNTPDRNLFSEPRNAVMNEELQVKTPKRGLSRHPCRSLWSESCRRKIPKSDSPKHSNCSIMTRECSPKTLCRVVLDQPRNAVINRSSLFKTPNRYLRSVPRYAPMIVGTKTPEQATRLSYAVLKGELSLQTPTQISQNEQHSAETSVSKRKRSVIPDIIHLLDVSINSALGMKSDNDIHEYFDSNGCEIITETAEKGLAIKTSRKLSTFQKCAQNVLKTFERRSLIVDRRAMTPAGHLHQKHSRGFNTRGRGRIATPVARKRDILPKTPRLNCSVDAVFVPAQLSVPTGQPENTQVINEDTVSTPRSPGLRPWVPRDRQTLMPRTTQPQSPRTTQPQSPRKTRPQSPRTIRLLIPRTIQETLSESTLSGTIPSTATPLGAITPGVTLPDATLPGSILPGATRPEATLPGTTPPETLGQEDHVQLHTPPKRLSQRASRFTAGHHQRTSAFLKLFTRERRPTSSRQE